MTCKILFSNIGYARDIDGSLNHHVWRVGRHFYCAVPVQESVLRQLKAIIAAARPDVCCFVEIDEGTGYPYGLNQIEALKDEEYPFHDAAGKYGPGNWLGQMWLHKGKSNGFISRMPLSFERLYFTRGGKRLIYRLTLPGGLHVYFAHFSLSRKTRMFQMEELRARILQEKGEVMILADFNIMGGFQELAPLLQGTDLHVLNEEQHHTFTFFQSKYALDLCICSAALAATTRLHIIPQPFSDHAALLVEIVDPAE